MEKQLQTFTLTSNIKLVLTAPTRKWGGQCICKLPQALSFWLARSIKQIVYININRIKIRS